MCCRPWIDGGAVFCSGSEIYSLGFGSRQEAVEQLDVEAVELGLDGFSLEGLSFGSAVGMFM